MSALESYFVEKPDVVLLDLVMKGMYGLDVLAKLRELDPAARVIVVSADVQTSSREMVQAAGAAGSSTSRSSRAALDAGGPQRARRRRLNGTDAVQQDALIELLNIGFGRAAASLSQLTGHASCSKCPQVSVHPIDELAGRARAVIETNVASVHQIFSGPVAGDALLILDQSGAACSRNC